MHINAMSVHTNEVYLLTNKMRTTYKIFLIYKHLHRCKYIYISGVARCQKVGGGGGGGGHTDT